MLEKISHLKSLYNGPIQEKKSRKEIFEETGKILLYPTEMSYEIEKEGYLIPKGKCNRQVFFDFYEFQKTDPQTIKLLETYELGKAVEYMIKKELQLTEQAGIEDFEVEFKQEFNGSDVIVSGKKDVVLKDGTIIGIKSTKDSEASLRMLAEGPYPVHYAQIGMYLAECKMNGTDAKLLLWYKGKINLTDVIHELQLSDDGFLICNGKTLTKYNFESSLRRLFAIEKSIKEKVIPQRDFPIVTPGNINDLYNLGIVTTTTKNKIERSGQAELLWECTECEYRSLCQASDESN